MQTASRRWPSSKGWQMADSSRLHKLAEAGVSAWIDSLSREMLHSGALAELMVEDAIVGVTSNPTIFQKALAEGELYDAQLSEVAGATDDATEIFFALAMDDIREACDLMLPVWERTTGVDGWVSLEVDPTLAYDRERTFDQAVRFNKEIGRPNLYVKIPATEPGLGAIEDCIAKSVPINVTLIFSLERYAAVAEAYLRGLERLIASGGDPGNVLSVASFFVSRVDSEADRRLEAAGRPDLQGKLAIANAKLAYSHYLDVFGDDRWAFLAGKGARPQRCLWASTSAKNPAYRDVIYVEELIGADTVNTMPLETVRAFQEHGEVKADSLTGGVDDANRLLADLAAAGVDYDDVVATLEAEGVEKFADSFAALLDGIRAKVGSLASV
jgi:transaldolase